MGQHHDHGGRLNEHRLFWAGLLTVVTMLAEAIGGVLSGSLALLADAGHMLTDSGALALSLAAARIALRPRSAKNTYGYRRAEVMGALANSSSMLVLSLFIIVEALQRMHAPHAIRAQGLLSFILLRLPGSEVFLETGTLT